jgi:hypothetical protein
VLQHDNSGKLAVLILTVNLQSTPWRLCLQANLQSQLLLRTLGCHEQPTNRVKYSTGLRCNKLQLLLAPPPEGHAWPEHDHHKSTVRPLMLPLPW